MKNSIFFIGLLLLISVFALPSFAQTEKIDSDNFQNTIWPENSTRTLVQGRKVVPIFGIKKMGAANNMEWQVQPLFFFLAPNLGLKKQWIAKQDGISFSSFHKINYPSLYLNLIAREGAGGVLPSNSVIPPMIGMKNELLIGFNRQNSLLTLRVGMANAFNLGSGIKDFPDIDAPFLYTRTLALNHSPTLYTGVNFNWDFLPKLNLEADITAFKVKDTSDFVFESKLILFWKKSDKFGLKAGAAAAHGAYPYGTVFEMIPVIDVLFGFGGKKMS